MFEESKQRLLNGVSSMAREMKSPKISKHVPPFVHAVINPNRNRKEGSTPRSVYYTILSVLAISVLFVIMLLKFKA
ncbi:hypothetical protein HKI87_16g82950 [Chloropicon roscoffensis]|uniref:Uncharacterized protein n=2 Tax=Chloropicon roscoffensis TaxID=1461544 RepID=A0AAX4PM27_9CHLO